MARRLRSLHARPQREPPEHGGTQRDHRREYDDKATIAHAETLRFRQRSVRPAATQTSTTQPSRAKKIKDFYC